MACVFRVLLPTGRRRGATVAAAAARCKWSPGCGASGIPQKWHIADRTIHMASGDASTLDRTCGALIGLACGDAVGTTSEFQPRGTFPEIRGMVGGGVFRLDPGQWTDDTSLALCLAQSLIERAGHDPRDQLERYLAWWQDGRLSSNGRCFDIGTTTKYSLHEFRASKNTRMYCGGTDPMQSGNGSLMRLAPVPMLLRLHPELAVAVAGESSRTTHGSAAAMDSCRYFAGLLVGAMAGAPKEKLLAKGGFVPDGLPGDFWSPMEPAVAEVVLGASFSEREPPTIRNSGYVVRTLEAALWAFQRSSAFEEGVLLVANLGDDSDTVGAVYGQLAGTYYGLSGIPDDWRNKLALRGLIESMAEELHDMSTRVEPHPPHPPSMQPASAPSTAPMTMPPISGRDGATGGARAAVEPAAEEVTCFFVRPEVKEPQGSDPHVEDGSGNASGGGGVVEDARGTSVGHFERAANAYWDGGVAAHYRRLEDEYVKIAAKIGKRSYDTVEAFDLDASAAMVFCLPDPDSAASADKLGCESQDSVAGRGATWNGEIAERRKALLTAEFAARLEIERVMVERVAQARHWEI